MKIQAKSRSDFRHFHEITTRWMDNDAYGHVNNVVYYSWFDTVVNEFLISHQVLDVEKSNVIGLVIETQCNYFASVAFPDKVTAGVSVSKLGNSSVRYELGIFKADETEACAQGHFVHVYVDRASRRPVLLPDALRLLLQSIKVIHDDSFPFPANC
jgi:acyl-CoA thioester hydrolase